MSIPGPGRTVGRFTVTESDSSGATEPDAAETAWADLSLQVTFQDEMFQDDLFARLPSPPALPPASIPPTTTAAVDPRSPTTLHRLYRAHLKQKKLEAMKARIPDSAASTYFGLCRPATRAAPPADIVKMLPPADSAAGERKVAVLLPSPATRSAFSLRKR